MEMDFRVVLDMVVGEVWPVVSRVWLVVVLLLGKLGVVVLVLGALGVVLLVLGALGVVLLVLGSRGVTRTTRSRGAMGERAVRQWGRARLREYGGFHNVTLQMSSGTTQIDHVFVSVHGVFVVETKTMRGWIAGGAGDRQWTQTLCGSRYQFYNPLLQNLGHVRVLQWVLGVDWTAMRSVVVFMSEVRFTTRMPDNIVVGARRLVAPIRSFDRAVLSEADVERVCHTIDKKRLPVTLATHRAHARHVRHVKRRVTM